ncbi:MAG: PIN domain-containing protein [Candidatus Kariarchaeaceae archaeon]
MKIFNKAIKHQIVVDTSVLLEFLIGLRKGFKIKEMIIENQFIETILVTPITLVEIYYVIRRKETKEFAEATLSMIQKLCTSVPILDYYRQAAEIKALTSFALADCCCIALAEHKNLPVIFLHEKEIDNRLRTESTKDYLSRIIFIDDFQVYNDK